MSEYELLKNKYYNREIKNNKLLVDNTNDNIIDNSIKVTDHNEPVINNCENDYQTQQYNRLCQDYNFAKNNNEILSVLDGFKRLNGFSNSEEMCKKCLDKLTFSNPDELAFLGKEYNNILIDSCNQISEKCISTASIWQSYNQDYGAFISNYNYKPHLLKLWTKYPALVIIVGIITLFWGFIFYFGAVLLEFIVRYIWVKSKKSKDDYNNKEKELNERNKEIQSLLVDLRKPGRI